MAVNIVAPSPTTIEVGIDSPILVNVQVQQTPILKMAVIGPQGPQGDTGPQGVAGGMEPLTGSAAAKLAAQANGTIGMLGGLFYEVDNTATGTASATHFLGVDGLIPAGVVTPQHYGAKADYDATANTGTDDSDAISAAWEWACKNAGKAGWGIHLHFPRGHYLITKSNVFGTSSLTGAYRKFLISGDSDAVLQFQPVTGGSTFGDRKFYLYDGGYDATHKNAFILLDGYFENLLIYYDARNLTAKDEIGHIRLYGDATSQAIEARGCAFWADGVTSNTADHTITAITQASPAVITSAGHGLVDGQRVYLTGIVGMTELNGLAARVSAATADTFAIVDDSGANIDSTAYTAYTSGGTVTEHTYSVLHTDTGAVNGSECKYWHCRIHNFGTLRINSNPQAVDFVMDECDAWLIYDHFMIVTSTGGAGIRINGGSWIHETTSPLAPQYLASVTGGGIGVGNYTFDCTGIKFELRSAGGALIGAETQTGSLVATFDKCNFDGSITGTRTVTKLHSRKVVRFNDCTIPSEFQFDFIAPDSRNTSYAWADATMGLVHMTSCTFSADMSQSMATLGAAGRVVADNCQFVTGVGGTYPMAVDFDSNPNNGGYAEMQPKVKTVQIKPRQSPWYLSRDFEVDLPYGAQLVKIEVHRPAAASVTTVRNMEVKDGDGVVFATDATAENADQFINVDLTGLDRAKSRTTANERRIIVSVPSLTNYTRGGYAVAHYI